MSLKIKYLDGQKSSSKNTAIFLAKDSKFSDFKGNFDDKINQKIVNFLKNNKKTKEDKIFSLNLEFDQRLIMILIAKKNDSLQSENLGAKFYHYIKTNNINNILLLGSSFSTVKNNIKFNEFIHGVELKAYEFNLYKTKKNKKEININILKNKNLINKNIKNNLDAVLNGINFTRDLVSEPGNILHPDEYTKRLTKLRKYGLKVTVYDQKKL